MSFRSMCFQLLKQDRGEQALSSVTVLAVSATVLLGVVQIGTSVFRQTRDRTTTLLDGEDSADVKFTLASSRVSRQVAAADAASSPIHGRTAMIDDLSEAIIDNPALLSAGSSLPLTATEFQLQTNNDMAAPSNGFSTAPLEPPVTSEPVQQPIKPVPPVAPADPSVEEPAGEDPGVRQPAAEPKRRAPRNSARRRSANEEDLDEEEDEENSDDKAKSKFGDILNSMPPGGGGASGSSFSGAPSSGFGGFSPTGFPGNNGMPGSPQNGFSSGMQNPYAANLNGLGTNANPFLSTADPLAVLANYLQNQNQSTESVSSRESAETAAGAHKEAQKSGPRRASSESKGQGSGLQRSAREKVVVNEKVADFLSEMMESGSQVAAVHHEEIANPFPFIRTSGTIEVIGIDRSDTALPRLQVVCRKPFQQIHVEGNNRRLAFNAPQPDLPRFIPLDAEMLKPGMKVMIFGIESESAEFLTYQVPAVESSEEVILQADHYVSEPDVVGQPRLQSQSMDDGMFTRAVELAEQ